ncbi:hypothetical protein [Leptospira jelokensis]|uniref:Uncharacterized protein n=1 Tax=Leptospira jelokensis TaxID=2484931 RepID=A0A4Z0ZNM5_9LEPT|nr:hypothetical protein [Leptospira jelokensis]TGL58616.1 hypothetical protein EHQ62_17120 [Leptospira jelokensis]
MTGLRIPFSDYHYYGDFDSEQSFGYLEIHSPLIRSPFKLLSKNINGPIVSKRSLNLGGTKLSFSVKYEALYEPEDEISGFTSESGGVPFEYIFFLNSAVYLFVRNIDGTYFQLNGGVIRNVQKSTDAKGEETRTVECDGFEKILENFQVNLDFGTEDQTKSKRTSENISSAITEITEVIKSQANLKDAVSSIWDNLFYDFIQGAVFKRYPLFGGKRLIAKSSNQIENSHLILNVCQESYSQNFIQQVMVAGNLSIGSSGISIMELIRQFASPPLYEIFVDPLSSALLTEESFGSESERSGTPDQVAPLSFVPGSENLSEVYSVQKRSANFIFRQTPYFYWDYLDQSTEGGRYKVLRGPHYELDFDKIQNVSLNESADNVYSGVMVSPNISSLFGLVLSKPIYNTSLITLVGQNVLTVKINGMNMKGEVTETKKNDFKEALDKIRDMIFYIFCNPKNLKHITGSVKIAFTPVRVGVPFVIKNRPKSGSVSQEENSKANFNIKAIESSLGDHGYVVSVTDTFNPNGEASSSIEFKWMDSPIDFTDLQWEAS